MYNPRSYTPELIEKLEKTSKKISDMLFSIRKSKGYTQKDLADIIGSSRRRVKKGEYSSRRMNIALFFIICKELEIDMNKFAEEVYSVIHD